MPVCRNYGRWFPRAASRGVSAEARVPRRSSSCNGCTLNLRARTCRRGMGGGGGIWFSGFSLVSFFLFFFFYLSALSREAGKGGGREEGEEKVHSRHRARATVTPTTRVELRCSENARERDTRSEQRPTAQARVRVMKDAT